MFTKVLQDISRPQWFEIIRHLKQSQGLAVGELAEKLGMSYMGVKQHCVSLQKKGYLDTWRRAKAIGRPEKIYRLTDKADPIFPEGGNELTLGILEGVAKVYGPSAPDKLLFNYFQAKADAYLAKIKGDAVAEKATALAKLRFQEGYLSDCTYIRGEGLKISEFHHPLASVLAAYPSVVRMEEGMFERVLGTKVKREEEHAAGLTKTTFLIDSLGR